MRFYIDLEHEEAFGNFVKKYQDKYPGNIPAYTKRKIIIDGEAVMLFDLKFKDDNSIFYFGFEKGSAPEVKIRWYE